MMEQVTLTLFEIRDMYEAVWERYDTGIKACEETMRLTDDRVIVARMLKRIDEYQARQRGCKLLFFLITAHVEDKARCRP